MRKIFLLAISFLILNSLIAQDDAEKKPSYWKLTGKFDLNFSQSSYSNWAAVNAMSGKLTTRFDLNYKKNDVDFKNILIMGYGLAFQGSDRHKIDDRIDFSSSFGYKAFGKVDYTALATFKSQFDLGYRSYPVQPGALYYSKFMAPATTTMSLGFDYKPSKEFSLFVSPISGKLTFVLDDSLSNVGAFGVKPGKNTFYEFGASLRASYTKKIKDNITLNSRVDLFSNLLRYPENVDIDWSLDITFQLTKYLKSTIGFQAKYDDDMRNTKPDRGPELQFRQFLDIGFSYSF